MHSHTALEFWESSRMYESEANIKSESAGQIPAEVISALKDFQGKVLARTVLPWSEHCTECVWPTCYSTCELYSPRPDGRCQRFADGMVRIDCPEAENSYLLKIRFKQWAKLWTPGNVRLFSANDARTREQRDRMIGTTLYQIALPAKIKNLAKGKRYSFKKRMVYRRQRSQELPGSFVIECFNPEARIVKLSLTMRATDEKVRIPFQKLMELTPGFHRLRIPLEEIRRSLNVAEIPFNVELIPDGENRETTLYFGLMDFVQEVPEKVKKIKCVVWDLDNTMWNGILVEDGPAKLRLKAGIIDVIKALDARGILLSIASKNNAEEALQVLKDFGIDDYFLCPQISWNPKSQAVAAVAQQLNIGKDSLLFVDDSPFELEEVRLACPEVQTLDARRYLEIPEMDCCQVPVTAESAGRRALYKVEQRRQELAEGFGDDYMGFLKHCNIRLRIQPMTEETLERVHELTQRTNQMNFSGNRYDRSVLKEILSTPHLDTYVLECEDRFGSYGVIGFSIVDNREPRMTDLMFSCRIQSKRVEHAFMAYIIRKYIVDTGKDFHANYRKTPRNAPSGRVFADLGMRETGVAEGVSSLLFSKDWAIQEDGLVEIVAHDRSVSMA